MPAQGTSAGTAETRNEAQGEARRPGAEGMRPFYLNTCNLRLLRYLKPANKLGALPAGAASWHVPGHGKLTTRQMMKLAAEKRV